MKYIGAAIIGLTLSFSACVSPAAVNKTLDDSTPTSFSGNTDTINSANVQWKDFLNDPYLTALIDTALANNQELNITLQEIQVSKNEIRTRKGEYLPNVGIGAAGGVDKVGRYTSQGANDANTDIKPGIETPDPLQDYKIGAFATWEVDIWRKLRNGKESAVNRYLASIEGKNFMVTQLVAEIAHTYYELLALDNELLIIQQNIEIQNNAYKIVEMQKEAARVTELAVRRFEAQVLKTKGLQFRIQQEIIETENRINFLLGRFPQPIERNAAIFNDLMPTDIQSGIPTQLLENRPDIRQAEAMLVAAKLDVKVAKANFYPSLSINAGVGFQAFNPKFLVDSPESIIYSLAGDIAAPLINRNAIKATYYSANNKQQQAIYEYERSILTAYIEVVNELSNIDNLEKSYDLKSLEVEALTKSIEISNNLFSAARADYMEVLMTQRDALESRFELIETKQKQMSAMVNIYKALGGGWN